MHFKRRIVGHCASREQVCQHYHNVIQHYENFPMQYTEIFFSAVKIENFTRKKNDIFDIYAQNIYRGFTLEPPQRGGSNEYPQSMSWTNNKKNMYTPVYPGLTI